MNSPTVVDDGVLMGEVKQCAEVLDAMVAMGVVGQMVRPELFDIYEEQEGEALGWRVTVLEERLAAVEAMLKNSPTFVKVGNSDDSKGGGVEFGKNERLSGDDPSGRDFPPPLFANLMTAQVAILDTHEGVARGNHRIVDVATENRL